MENAGEQFKNALKQSFGSKFGGMSTSDLMKDLNKYSKEMKETNNIVGGLADKKTVEDIAKKHKKDVQFIEIQLEKGTKVEKKEHVKKEKSAEEIAMDHLWEDPNYYIKLKKMEGHEQLIRGAIKKGIADKLVGTKQMNTPIGKLYSFGKTEAKENVGNLAKKTFAQDLQTDPDYIDFKQRAKFKDNTKEFTHGTPNVTVDDPYIKKQKYSRPGKEETTEATGSGSSGAFVGPIAFKDSEFLKKSFAETPGKGKKLGEQVEKVEATEATGSGSVGGYSTPAMWAKTTKKKDWGPSRKTQVPGGAFVKVKKKCTKFPYCNQGDINALKITKNESVQEAIKNISKKHNISEELIKNILAYEISKIKQ